MYYLVNTTLVFSSIEISSNYQINQANTTLKVEPSSDSTYLNQIESV